MAASELLAWFTHILITIMATVLIVVYAILNEVSWIVAAGIIALNIITGAAGYSVGRQAIQTAIFKEISEASIHPKKKSGSVTLNIVVRDVEPIRTILEPNPITGKAIEIAKAENNNGSQEKFGQVKSILTVSQSENLGSDEKTPPTETLHVMTDMEKKEKLKALRAEKEVLKANEEEERWQELELFILYSEATENWAQGALGPNGSDLDEAQKTARYNWTMANRESKRRAQRLRRIELDIKALRK